ncbi:MAG: S-methyl-5'-thioadenosine phosphorylase [Thermoproteota archaeon]|nr:MAG: S-methyl-5'-thioadenosine phosphorylase [Candidatus Korarchaeota archaeon]
MKIGVIGGSGFYKLLGGRSIAVITEYGAVRVRVVEHKGREVYFISRHGARHEVPPFRVNYEGNMLALFRLGVERIIATNAVGAINTELKVGDIVLPSDMIDCTKKRIPTYFDGKVPLKELGRWVRHATCTPYIFCPELRAAAAKAAEEAGESIREGGVYCCTEGSRFETPAEIRAMKAVGGDLVGMTMATEATLARELGLCYMPICVVTNMAAGITGRELSHGEVAEVFSKRIDNVKRLILRTVELLPEERSCRCRELAPKPLQVDVAFK